MLAGASPFWVTVTACPSTVICAVRLFTDVLAWNEKPIAPPPVPVMVSQDRLLAARSAISRDRQSSGDLLQQDNQGSFGHYHRRLQPRRVPYADGLGEPGSGRARPGCGPDVSSARSAQRRPLSMEWRPQLL